MNNHEYYLITIFISALTWLILYFVVPQELASADWTSSITVVDGLSQAMGMENVATWCNPTESHGLQANRTIASVRS